MSATIPVLYDSLYSMWWQKVRIRGTDGCQRIEGADLADYGVRIWGTDGCQRISGTD